jgi:Predicted sugar phosphate isomerase involved in capsule formation
MTDKNHFAEVQGFLRLESEAIAQTAGRLQRDEIERVVQLLAACKGKIVILGVGKSGIIAQKIAATMTSTGTGALYLHPSDALHGGIGIINAWRHRHNKC